ncbi:hypothetical protein [Streptomyces spectabilis]|uniref:DUF3618 domain-containing protein n=1 Tax=Streptomyces spectabilis TaxID=68270 RepID=A0A5P2XLC8_STRST|nr:hypothetical protein [Streptomyces spectabilis]MBB5102123.1 hypothetical protein [Streptomyces spectabilis]MCI3907172.1 hypothetical protein [Streptomyces spectabilis]QEV63925.1 hypothetical protein CP982_38845 [Streptomyces spectabilis]GGV28903.1 hypothetical protein GCM10010245_46970 [Streptomyces spectabilis]
MDRSDRPHETGRDRATGHSAADAAREGAADVLHESAAQGRDLYERMREQAVDEAEAQLRRLAATIRDVSTDLRHMGDSAKPDSPAASLVRQAAGGGHRVADRIEHRGAADLLDDVRHFARRRPGLFLIGAALAGFAASRVGRGTAAAEPATADEPGREVPATAYTPDPALAPGEGPPPMPRLGTSGTAAPEPPGPTPPPPPGRGW